MLDVNLDSDSPQDLTDTPTFLSVNVGNGGTQEEVRFDLYGSAGVWIDVLVTNLDEWGALGASVPIPAVPAGAYEIRVTGTVTDQGGTTFTVLGDPLDEAVEPDELIEDDEPTWPLDTQRWRLIDTSVYDNVGEYVFPWNPAQWTNPRRPVNHLTHDVTTSPSGAALAWEAARAAWTFEFSGYLNTQAHYEALKFWAGLNRRFWLIDHRDEPRLVAFEHFDARPRIVPGEPWAHDYTIRAVHFYRRKM